MHVEWIISAVPHSYFLIPRLLILQHRSTVQLPIGLHKEKLISHSVGITTGTLWQWWGICYVNYVWILFPWKPLNYFRHSSISSSENSFRVLLAKGTQSVREEVCTTAHGNFVVFGWWPLTKNSSAVVLQPIRPFRFMAHFRAWLNTENWVFESCI